MFLPTTVNISLLRRFHTPTTDWSISAAIASSNKFQLNSRTQLSNGVKVLKKTRHWPQSVAPPGYHFAGISLTKI